MAALTAASANAERKLSAVRDIVSDLLSANAITTTTTITTGSTTATASTGSDDRSAFPSAASQSAYDSRLADRFKSIAETAADTYSDMPFPSEMMG